VGAVIGELADEQPGVNLAKVGTGFLKGGAAGATFAKTGSLKKAGAASAAIGTVEGAIMSDADTIGGRALDAGAQGTSDFVSTLVGGGVGGVLGSEIKSEAAKEVAGSAIGAGLLIGSESLTEIGEGIAGQDGTPSEQLEVLQDPLPDIRESNQ
jgi:hypothetical protein